MHMLLVLLLLVVVLTQQSLMVSSFNPFHPLLSAFYAKPLHTSPASVTDHGSTAWCNMSTEKYPLKNNLIIRAARGEKVERTPVNSR